MTESIQDKMMNWCHANGIKLIAQNFTSKKFNNQLNYIEIPNSQTTILALKSKEIASNSKPHSLLYRFLTHYQTLNDKPLSLHFDSTINIFKGRIFWFKKALFIDVSLFSHSFLNYCDTFIIQCSISSDIPIESSTLKQIRSFIQSKTINIDLHHKFNTIKNGDILYVTHFSYQHINDIYTTFKRFGSDIAELIRIPYEYVERKAKLLIRFTDPSKVKAVLYGGAFCINRTSSNKYIYVSEQFFNRIKLEQSKQQPWDRIVIALREQQNNVQIIQDLDEYKRSLDVRARELYFTAIKNMIKSNKSNDILIALAQLRKDLVQFQTEGTFYSIPKQELKEISEYILNFIDFKNRIKLDYDEYKWQSNMNESMQSAMRHMMKITDKQIQTAMIDVLVEINNCIVSNKQQYDYFQIKFKLSMVLEHLRSSIGMDEKLMFLEILNKINDKKIINKYIQMVMNMLNQENFQLYFEALKTIKNACSNEIYDIGVDKDLIGVILTSLQHKKFTGSEWELCGVQIYELIDGNSSLIGKSLTIFSHICMYLFSNDNFKIAHCIWIDMSIQYGILKYNNNMNMNAIANTIIKVFIPMETLSDDQNNRMYQYGISILKRIFWDYHVDVQQFIQQITLKSEQDSILIASVLLDCDLKECILFAVQNMVSGNQTLKKIMNFFNSGLTSLEKVRLLTFLYRVCSKMEGIAYEPRINTMHVTPICQEIIALLYKLLINPQNQNSQIQLDALQVLTKCGFLDLKNNIVCKYQYFPQLIEYLHNLLSSYSTTNIHIIDACIKCVSTLLYICDNKYIGCDGLWSILDKMYKVRQTKGIIECISYLISADKSLNEIKAMKIVTQILNDNTNNVSEILLSLAHNLALRVQYKTFKPLMDTVMNEILMPLEKLYNPEYAKQTDVIIKNIKPGHYAASELEQTHELVTYLNEFLSIYGNNMKMPYIHRILKSLSNILDPSYNTAITSNIKFICYDTCEHMINCAKKKTKVIETIFSLIYSKMKAVTEYEEFIILSKLLHFIKNILREKQNKIDIIIAQSEEQFKETDEIDVKTVKLAPIGEEDEDDLFDNIDSVEYSQYKNKYGPILTIHKKIQNAKRRKCLSPLKEPQQLND